MLPQSPWLPKLDSHKVKSRTSLWEHTWSIVSSVVVIAAVLLYVAVIKQAQSHCVDSCCIRIVSSASYTITVWIMFPESVRERDTFCALVIGRCYFSLVSQADTIQENLLWCLCFNNSSLQLFMSYYCSSCQKGAFTSYTSPCSSDLAMKGWLWSL